MTAILILATSTFTTFSIHALAQEIAVVDVKRNITLSDEDVIYKDYYLNAGEASALRKNMVVQVKRKINIKDSGTKSVGDFETPVAQLKIIHIGTKVSVAREHKLIPRDDEAMLEQIGIMSGDRIDLTGSFIDNTKPVYKRKTTETEPPAKAEETKTADTAATINNQLNNQINNPPNAQPTNSAAAPVSSQEREPATQINTVPKIQQQIQQPVQAPITTPKI